jgi:hypothetical protein
MYGGMSGETPFPSRVLIGLSVLLEVEIALRLAGSISRKKSATELQGG